MQPDITTAHKLLENSGISLIDAARMILNILDYAPDCESPAKRKQFCRKIIENAIGQCQKPPQNKLFKSALSEYLKSKSHLRKKSVSDIKSLGMYIIKKTDISNMPMSLLNTQKCEKYLERAFKSPSQFNKARIMLHGLFEFAIKNDWAEKNPVKKIRKKKVFEKEIRPLGLDEISKLMKSANEYPDCLAGFAIMLYAGIRPHEVARLKWKDVDFTENVITITPKSSKTGGARHVSIYLPLQSILKKCRKSSETPICPKNWNKRWRTVREEAGFKDKWVQDVLRHTFASYHFKYFQNLDKLQTEMGHRDKSLLRFRYINLRGITIASAKKFWNEK